MSDADAKKDDPIEENDDAVAGEDASGAAADEPEAKVEQEARAEVDDPLKCPHCGQSAKVVDSVELRFVCAVCGRARVPVEITSHVGYRDGTAKRSHRERKLLAQATASRDAALAWKVIAGFTAGFSFFAVCVLGLVISVAKPATFGSAVGFAVSLSPLAFAAYAFARSRANESRIEGELGSAWQMVAVELVEGDDALDAAGLGNLMSLPIEPAKQLFAAARKSPSA